MYMYQFSISIKITCLLSFYLGLVLSSQFDQFRPRDRVWSKFSVSKTIAETEHHLQCFSDDFEWSGSLPNRPRKINRRFSCLYDWYCACTYVGLTCQIKTTWYDHFVNCKSPNLCPIQCLESKRKYKSSAAQVTFRELRFYAPQHNNLKTVPDTGNESKMSISMQKTSVNI